MDCCPSALALAGPPRLPSSQHILNQHSRGSTELIQPYIAKACEQAGFEIHMKGWENNGNRIRFCCRQGRCFQDKDS